MFCLKCGSKFKELKYLKSHIKTQHSELKYGCEHCELRFKSSAKLTTHVKVHRGDNRVVCPICAKVYKNKLVLKAHKYNKHGNREATEKKIWTCAICSKVYGSDRGLRYHMDNLKHSKVYEESIATLHEDEVVVIQLETEDGVEVGEEVIEETK